MQKRLMDELHEILGNKGVLHTPEDLAVYGYDGTFVEALPEIVVLPETTEQVSQIVKLAAGSRTPIVPRGMGSGLAAASVPFPAGGIVLCLDSHEPYFGDRYRKFNRAGRSRSCHCRHAIGG